MSDPHWIPQINSQNRRPRRQGQRIDLALSVPFSDVLRSPGTSPVSSASNTPAPSLPNPFSQRPWRPDFSALLFGDCDATGVTTSLNNQIAHPNHGLFAYLELKKSAHTKDPQIQLSTWALSEHIKMQAMGWDVGIPRLAIAVMDVTWHAYLVFWDEQSSYGKLVNNPSCCSRLWGFRLADM